MSRVRSGVEPEDAVGLRLLITGGFSNETQARAHFVPLLAVEDVREATLVADAPGPDLPKLRTVTPPSRLVRLVGWAGAKALVSLVLARRTRPDWIVCYSLVPHGLSAWLMAKLAPGSRVLYHMIGGPMEWEGGGWTGDNKIVGRLPRPVPPLERFFIRVIRTFAVVITMGDKGRRSLIQRGVSPDRIVTVPASFDASRFRPRRSDMERAYDIVTVGALIPRKRTTDFLRAVAGVREAIPDVRAAIVGVGPLEETLRRQASDLGLEDTLDFLGHRDDMHEIYASSSIFVLTSREEGLSIALIEAMASGLPVAISDVGEASDLVRDGENGYLFPVGDFDLLATRLCELLDDQGLRERVGTAAASDARAYAGHERITELYRTVLRTPLGG